ncbi:ABC transporter permease [Pseudoduganella chitinolytica]|uniref:ABC transporter permease n=1 Tax=Pseudoduganella chitinolytica TaxID=34070 RepID=A0ABY8BFV1_9BURK|nr:ABC transporter permease [Pseudoduganella chitinolytica]WEF34801.1 ABC transporter permease [Pseudoduganella chitinolytica]
MTARRSILVPAAGLRIGRVVAADTVREALRGRLPWLLVALLLGGLAVSGFIGALALTDTRATQAALLAPLLRCAAAAIVAVFTVASISREAHDKQAEMLLALPAGRAAWLLGRLAGFAVLAVLVALPAGLLAAWHAAPAQAALWTLGVLGELWIVAAFATFCALGLATGAGHAAPALCATLGFYLLARVAGILQALAQDAASPRLVALAADGIAVLLPRLDTFARTEWLLYGTGGVADAATLLGQAVIYVVLLAAASLVDLQRREY